MEDDSASPAMRPDSAGEAEDAAGGLSKASRCGELLLLYLSAFFYRPSHLQVCHSRVPLISTAWHGALPACTLGGSSKW